MNETDQPDTDSLQTNGKLHMGIAEQGKLYALQGKHDLALMYYRQAIHMAVHGQEHEVFFRHYLECVMESLEHMGAFDEVLAYCDKALEFYDENPPPNPLAQRDLAHVYERKGAILLKRGERDAALKSFELAIQVLDGTQYNGMLPRVLLRWIKTGMHIEPSRVLAEQRRANYFSVRSETVDASKAVKLPDERLFGSPSL